MGTYSNPNRGSNYGARNPNNPSRYRADYPAQYVNPNNPAYYDAEQETGSQYATRDQASHYDASDRVDTEGGTRVGREPPEPNADAQGYIIRFTRKKGLTNPKVLTRTLRFPYGPLESIRVSKAFEHTEFQTLRSGSHSRPAGQNLLTVSFSTLVMDWSMNVASFPGRQLDPIDFVASLRRLMNSGTPFGVEMGTPNYQGQWDVDKVMTLRSVDADERAGEIDTRYVECSLVEYREADVKVRGQVKGKGKRGRGDWTAAERKAIDKNGKTPGIKGEVTFKKLAVEHYGAASFWKQIARANNNPLLKGIPGDASIGDWIKRKNKGKAKAVKILLPASREVATVGPRRRNRLPGRYTPS